jgi:hypothetical protein
MCLGEACHCTSHIEANSDGVRRVPHLRRSGIYSMLRTQRLRAGLTCDAPPALGRGPKNRQGVLSDALPALVLGSKFIVGVGVDFGFGLVLGDGLKRELRSRSRLRLAPRVCILGR